MATQVYVHVPTLCNMEMKTQLSGQLSTGQKISATIIFDQSQLMPWIIRANEEVADFTLISSFVYGIDRCISRRANSVDGWSRELQVSIPVFELKKWQACQVELQALLSFLTGDYWNISFYKNTLQFPSIDEINLDPIFAGKFSHVNLFSGGLDSLIGAIDILEQHKSPLLFVSHYDRTMSGPKKDQHDLSEKLKEKYGNLFLRLPSIGVYLSSTSLNSRETTSRSRSLLFIGIAMVLADVKDSAIVVPENGTVSLNYPLSPSRRSACSTRTTHPSFIARLEDLMQKLNIQIRIENPYKFKTKGEMVKDCKNKDLLLSAIAMSNSCGKRGHRAHWDTLGSHCGICMPCLYRRASLQGNSDNTDYGNSINGLNFQRKKGQDVGSLLEFLKLSLTSKDIKLELITNGLRDLQNLDKYVQLVKRSRTELSNWVRNQGNAVVRNKAGL